MQAPVPAPAADPPLQQDVAGHVPPRGRKRYEQAPASSVPSAASARLLRLRSSGRPFDNTLEQAALICTPGLEFSLVHPINLRHHCTPRLCLTRHLPPFFSYSNICALRHCLLASPCVGGFRFWVISFGGTTVDAHGRESLQSPIRIQDPGLMNDSVLEFTTGTRITECSTCTGTLPI